VDNTGNRTAVDEAGEIGARHVDWGYDEEYKLTSETMYPSGQPLKDVAFDYDDVGNRLKRLDDTVQTQDFAYDHNDRIVALNGQPFLYDGEGNTLSDTANVYTWDLEDRMLSAEGGVHSLENSYDGDGMRLSSLLDGLQTTFSMDPNTDHYRVLEEQTTTGTLSVSYAYGKALLKQSVGPRFYLADASNTTRALVSSTQALTDTYAFEGFGREASSSGTSANRYGFAGEETTDGLINLRARQYSPAVGAFLSADRFLGLFRQPRSLHRYAYAGVNPINRNDPSGLFFGEVSISLAVFGVLLQVKGATPPAVAADMDIYTEGCGTVSNEIKTAMDLVRQKIDTNPPPSTCAQDPGGRVVPCNGLVHRKIVITCTNEFECAHSSPGIFPIGNPPDFPLRIYIGRRQFICPGCNSLPCTILHELWHQGTGLETENGLPDRYAQACWNPTSGKKCQARDKPGDCRDTGENPFDDF
ncbi:MAG: RHS repeat-associated core domain-containing protein, partial [Acidobacteriota bacterium]